MVSGCRDVPRQYGRPRPLCAGQSATPRRQAGPACETLDAISPTRPDDSYRSADHAGVPAGRPGEGGGREHADRSHACPAGNGPVALLSPSEIDNPLDAGSPEPPPLSAPVTAQAAPPLSAPVSAQAAAPARALTPAPMIPGSTIAQALPSLAAEPRPALEEAAP